MPQCKYCGQVTVWPQPYVKGQRPNDPDTGLPHDCPAFKGDKYIDTKPQEREREEPAQAQGPNRYESAYLIPKEEWQLMLDNAAKITKHPKEEWQLMLDNVAKITKQLEHLSIFYDSVMQEIEAIRNIVHEQQSYRKHQQTLAEAEGQYDNDKEHGLA